MQLPPIISFNRRNPTLQPDYPDFVSQRIRLVVERGVATDFLVRPFVNVTTININVSLPTTIIQNPPDLVKITSAPAIWDSRILLFVLRVYIIIRLREFAIGTSTIKIAHKNNCAHRPTVRACDNETVFLISLAKYNHYFIHISEIRFIAHA